MDWCSSSWLFFLFVWIVHLLLHKDHPPHPPRPSPQVPALPQVPLRPGPIRRPLPRMWQTVHGCRPTPDLARRRHDFPLLCPLQQRSPHPSRPLELMPTTHSHPPYRAATARTPCSIVPKCSSVNPWCIGRLITVLANRSATGHAPCPSKNRANAGCCGKLRG